jgi:subtilase family protein
VPKNPSAPGRLAGDHPPSELPSQRMLVVIAKPETALRAGATGVASLGATDTSELNRILNERGARMQTLFGETEERLQAKSSTPPAPGTAIGAEMPELHRYYTVQAPDEQLDEIATQLASLPEIAGAYVTPAPQPASAGMGARAGEIELNRMMAVPIEAPPVTADFTPRQGYLDQAPGGIDARYAWTQLGGRGAGVQIIDCEGAWRFTHEDLLANQGGVIRTPTTDIGWRNHGTAVMGEVGADVNAFGVTGICPDATTRGCSIFDTGGLPGAVVAAADRLRPGDIILIEVQYGHPTKGYTSIEWWPAEFAAIRYAVNRGVIVVEAAGNGNNDLDDPVYNAPLAGFPADWRNPFNRSLRDSGAILVGAGAPPPGTHGRDYGPDRSRLDFSNYGSAVDVQGWGREVTTTSYGDLQGGGNEDLWYTDQFSGTSSASPIVVGALGCVEGVLRAEGRIALSPARARDLLRNSGSPQQDAPGRPRTQRIGNRPNLRQLIALARQTREWIGVQFTGAVAAGVTQRWFTYNWPAHWHVIWTVVPTSPRSGGPQINWSVQVERANDTYITYWISITNLTPEAVNIEARYAVVGW